ncbi:hypothetical protein COTS27_00599 [Spirochaetota bacterium]|nr:hypothetical protein COTS27_00599 [Spirochaetota bacterium]
MAEKHKNPIPNPKATSSSHGTSTTKFKGLTTELLHNANAPKDPHGGVHPAIQRSVTYTYDSVEELIGAFQGNLPKDHPSGFTYARSSSPTVTHLESRINHLENGISTVCTATGMAAIILPILALLRAEDHIITSKHLFGNTVNLFNTLKRFGIDLDCVDMTDMREIEAAIKPGKTRIIFLETISNPLTYIPDLENIQALAAHHDIITIVDNTLTTPYFFKPQKLGFTFSHHSLTKYLGGHAAALGGSLTDLGTMKWQNSPNVLDFYKTTATAARSNSLAMQQIRKKGLRDMGSTLSADSAATIALGLETFVLRIERIKSNIKEIALYLEKHPKVARVYHPTLRSHPHHNRMNDWFSCTGSQKKEYFGSGILSFELKPPHDMLKMINCLKIFRRATHLGDTRSLVIPVAPTIFFESGRNRRQYLGISENLIRLSIGIEEVEDLLTDLAEALKKS